jgi:hypothetical protein
MCNAQLKAARTFKSPSGVCRHFSTPSCDCLMSQGYRAAWSSHPSPCLVLLHQLLFARRSVTRNCTGRNSDYCWCCSCSSNQKFYDAEIATCFQNICGSIDPASHRCRNRAVFMRSTAGGQVAALVALASRRVSKHGSRTTRQQGLSLGQLVWFPCRTPLRLPERRTFVPNTAPLAQLDKLITWTLRFRHIAPPDICC